MNELDKLGHGWLSLVSIPDGCNPTIDELLQLAQQVGFAEKYIPKAKSARNAWEIATNLGKKGVKVPVLDAVRLQILGEYGIEPVVRIKHENISRKAPILRRSLQEVRYVPFSRDDNGLGKEKYLQVENVATLEFDTKTHARQGYFSPAAHSWINFQVVQDLVDRLKAHQTELENNCSSNDIRAGIRDFLVDCHKISLIGGYATYYIPEQPLMYDQLIAMRNYVRGLALLTPGEKPLAYVFQVAADDPQAVKDVKQASCDEVAARLLALQREAVEFTKSYADKTGERRDKQAARLMSELFEIKSLINLLKESLQDDLGMLADLYAPCLNAVTGAQ